MIKDFLDELAIIKSVKKNTPTIARWPINYESDLLNFKLSKNLKEFYEWHYEVNCFRNGRLFWFMNQGIFSLDEAIYQRNRLAMWDKENKKQNWPWPLSWLPIGLKDNDLIIAVLSRNITQDNLLLESDLGSGDTNGYLFCSSLENLLRIELDIAKCLNLDVDFLSIDRNAISEIFKKYMPNAYYFSDNAYTEDHFSSQGQRNVFDIFDLDHMPEE